MKGLICSIGVTLFSRATSTFFVRSPNDFWALVFEAGFVTWGSGALISAAMFTFSFSFSFSSDSGTFVFSFSSSSDSRTSTGSWAVSSDESSMVSSDFISCSNFFSSIILDLRAIKSTFKVVALPPFFIRASSSSPNLHRQSEHTLKAHQLHNHSH